MIERIGQTLSDWSERYMPDPFVFALGLTLLTLLLGMLFGERVADKSLLESLQWLLYHTDADGAGGWLAMFYSTPWMKFAMQMCIVLITGHALATSRPVRNAIERIAEIAESPGGAVVLVALVACGASLLHWGLGAIAGALMAREVGRAFADRGVAVHYPLLGAAGYAGFLVWHGGLSGSAPLKVAETGHIGREVLGYEAASVPTWIPEALPISRTLFSSVNLVLVAISLVLIPLLFSLLMPEERSEMDVRDPSSGDEGGGGGEPSGGPGAGAVAAAGAAAAAALGLRWSGLVGWTTAGALAVVALAVGKLSGGAAGGPSTGRGAAGGDGSEVQSAAVRLLEGSAALNVVTWLVIGLGLVLLFGENGVGAWGLDSVNLLFLGLGILAHPSPKSYVDAVVEGTKGAAGIILQFPFYFGILGLLKASGLIHQVAEFFVSMSSEATFPIFAFLSAGLVNFFVPSGGGQWAVQGQVVVEAAHSLGVDLETAIVAFSWGDAWTNMLQPFWALPLLGIMGLEARDIIGYTALVMFVTGPLFMGILVAL